MDLAKLSDPLYVAEQLSTFLKSDGVAVGYYKAFWNALYTAPKGPTTYLVVLLGKVYLMETGQESSPFGIVDMLKRTDTNALSNPTLSEEDRMALCFNLVVLTLYCSRTIETITADHRLLRCIALSN